MPVPVLNWNIVNTALSSAVDQAIQFREVFFARKELFKSAGWVHQASSKGDAATFSTTPGNSNDVIAAAGDVGIGTAGNGAYWVGKSPAGWLPNGAQIEVLLHVDDADAVTPQKAPTNFCSSSYTGGNATTLPTITVVNTETTDNSSGWNIIPWAAPVAGNFVAGYTDRGDLDFNLKRTGVNEFVFCDNLRGNTDAIGGGKGDYRFFHRSVAFPGAGNVYSSSVWLSATYLRGLDPQGLNPSGGLEGSCTCWNIGSWLNGRDFEGEAIDVDIDMYHDWTSDQRYMGKVLDIRGTPNNLPWAELDDSETLQTYRKLGAGGNCWIYVPSAALPLP